MRPEVLPQPTHRAPKPPVRLKFPTGTILIVFYVRFATEYFLRRLMRLYQQQVSTRHHRDIARWPCPEMDAIVDTLSVRLGNQCWSVSTGSQPV